MKRTLYIDLPINERINYKGYLRTKSDCFGGYGSVFGNEYKYFWSMIYDFHINPKLGEKLVDRSYFLNFKFHRI